MNEFIDKGIANSSPWMLRTLMFLIAVSYPALATAEPTQKVGEVSLVLGQAVLNPGSHDSVDLKSGMSIAVGDEIETLSNGHVHIRFIDEALVSVRPVSRLSIERYDFDARQPEKSAVKFSLKEGVARSISGQAAKAAREKFRLNTPIAAIGVRGTDFVVGAIGGTTRALVNEGSIIMAPYSDGCRIEAYDPCLSNSLELSRETLSLAAIDANDSSPRLLRSETVREPDFLQAELKVAIAGAKSRPSSDVAQSLVNGAGVATRASVEQSSSNEVLLESTTNPVVQGAALLAAQLDPPSLDIQPEFTPEVAFTAEDIGSRQLLWGYYANEPSDTDRIALSRSQAAIGRSVTVGNLSYGLYRADRTDESRKLIQELSVVGFQLSSAQAVFNSETGIVAMAVRDGNLDINFQENTFTTSLTLHHALTGGLDFYAAGRVFDGGFFRAIDATQKVAGAVSFDGSEAGYLFERQLDNGTVSGLTLWGGK